MTHRRSESVSHILIERAAAMRHEKTLLKIVVLQKHKTPLCREALYLHLANRWAP